MIPQEEYVAERQRMVEEQLINGPHEPAIRDPFVLRAMRAVPRHAFVPADVRPLAYSDQALPIGAGQTISQPYIVALTLSLAKVRPGHRVLEVGTGCGYEAAVLAAMTDQAYSVEIVEELAERARRTLGEIGARVHLRVGDGYRGWPEIAPFDAIIVSAAAPAVPAPLIEQLEEDGMLVIPLGQEIQELSVFQKTGNGLSRRGAYPVRFVPMTGRIQQSG